MRNTLFVTDLQNKEEVQSCLSELQARILGITVILLAF